MSVITSNLSSLKAQGHLSRSRSDLSTAMERLSSGLRVNSAKDDAAGQAIGNRMESHIRGLNQAARNANDGISLTQTAQGVLDQVNNNLHRIRELTVQGLNEIYNGEMGDKIQAEINLRLKEIDRLVEVSHYNEIPLLNGKARPVSLQVGAEDNQVLNVDLGAPGFSVEEIGLLNLTFQGAPGTITPVNSLSGGATRVPLDSSLTTLTYDPPENGPNLVSGTSGSPTRPTLIQYGGENGRLHNYGAAVAHDTDTLQNTVKISPSITEYFTTSGARVVSRTYTDVDGVTLSATSRSIVRFDDKFWIQESLGGGGYQYFEAELIAKGDGGAIEAQVINDTAVIRPTPGGLADIRYLPMVNLAGSEYSVTIDDADETTNDALTLVRLDGRYYLEEALPDGTYAYFKADVTVKTGGTADVVEVVTSRDGSRKLVVEDQPYISGSSKVHLKPSNDNVIVNYVDLDGRQHSDVMRPDGNGDYIFHIDEFVDGEGAYKTAKVVRNEKGEYLLQTFNGASEVVLYYPLERTSSTNVADNRTVLTFREAGEAQRIRNPANPLEAIDKAIARVDEKRGQLGAIENRLSALVESNQITSTNLAAARSRIMDADYAVEATHLVKAQILQQAGTSMLAQANQVPEIALALLG